MMSPASYELQGMTVNLAERDVLRLVCYVREFMGMAADSTTSVLYAVMLDGLESPPHPDGRRDEFV